MTAHRALVALAVVALSACANRPPAPDWQANAKASSERAVAAYLVGNARVEAAELARARSEVGRTGRADLLARVELAQCAARVASLVFGPCEAFEPLRFDAGPGEQAYGDHLLARPLPADAVASLPASQRAVAGAMATAAAGATAAVAVLADPLSRLVAAGVLFEAGRADPALIALAIDTASAQGWRRPLLAWLGVALRRAEQAGAGDDVQRLRRRIGLARGAP